ncbi:DNA-binding response regulator [Paractinoplanes abujensis]|uniref:DNA-binding NarL/FixJ family response regulator n=1 Tax=Paractinoplanes abujensis TaxID=882441 RepID=A0A7W7CSQ0_9ACTN|nr:response regulator transcription factor [Actinoplanes abujensis]MBB4694017.1 DNA-binding NarL/FixJ family response regulator [Actinoplanes abujensis]GID21325.1 DNA-binding response regulator [Actinoplanes abujensis]
MRLLTVDDDPMVLTGLRMMFGGNHGVVVVGEAGDGDEAVTAVQAHWPDVVLMDIRMPRMDGVEATRRIRKLTKAPEVVMLTTFDIDELVVESIRNGACGFLLKDTPPDEIIAAVRSAAEGEMTISRRMLRPLVELIAHTAGGSRRSEAIKQLDSLTGRERQVAIGLGRGLSNAEIGAELHMGVSTVKGHVSRVLAKLFINNRAQAAVLIHEAGLV